MDLQTQGSEEPAPRKVSTMNERSARAMLGVSLSATTGQIKRAYRRQALDVHPDRGGDPAAFQRLVEAQRLLLVSADECVRQMPKGGQWLEAPAPTDRFSTQRTRTVPTATPRRVEPSTIQRRTPRRFADVLAEKMAAA